MRSTFLPTSNHLLFQCLRLPPNPRVCINRYPRLPIISPSFSACFLPSFPLTFAVVLTPSPFPPSMLPLSLPAAALSSDEIEPLSAFSLPSSPSCMCPPSFAPVLPTLLLGDVVGMAESELRSAGWVRAEVEEEEGDTAFLERGAPYFFTACLAPSFPFSHIAFISDMATSLSAKSHTMPSQVGWRTSILFIALLVRSSIPSCMLACTRSGACTCANTSNCWREREEERVW
mmetsp:Transcript_14354/g.36614  ORF Transcript_14354/g.36614 Transcript_14354/m.36614 type:complete len:231 (-) Transcript_14354:605-1297(-)